MTFKGNSLKIIAKEVEKIKTCCFLGHRNCTEEIFKTLLYKIEELIKWKKSSNRKPLIIRGARQVGKTWLMKEFGKEHYEKCCIYFPQFPHQLLAVLP